jgi:hypothetical protein
MKDKIPTSYICQCGREHPFAVWVFAHWRDLLVHKCGCGRVNQIFAGRCLGPAKRKRTRKGKGA